MHALYYLLLYFNLLVYITIHRCGMRTWRRTSTCPFIYMHYLLLLFNCIYIYIRIIHFLIFFNLLHLYTNAQVWHANLAENFNVSIPWSWRASWWARCKQGLQASARYTAPVSRWLAHIYTWDDLHLIRCDYDMTYIWSDAIMIWLTFDQMWLW